MDEPPQFAPVGEAESGQKLLRFLERRLALPANLLHRWLRTGQIRLNGRRCKPFDVVKTGDQARLPPFAFKLAAFGSSEAPRLPGPGAGLPPLLGVDAGVWAFNKPSGLPVQGGTGQADSLAARLERAYADLGFRPAPGHRLDRGTSGVLLVGATFPALRKLQQDFQNGRIHKEYLAWCEGAWPRERLLRHFMADEGALALEPAPGLAEAVCLARPLLARPDRTLLQIRLFTGRKRQIRRQLAACGQPIIGDARFGNAGGGLKLHACRVILPDGAEFCCLPPWVGSFAISALPDPIKSEIAIGK